MLFNNKQQQYILKEIVSLLKCYLLTKKKGNLFKGAIFLANSVERTTFVVLQCFGFEYLFSHFWAVESLRKFFTSGFLIFATSKYIYVHC